jgi:phosphopantetheinyl transferase (holo-ACP synthase)
MCATCGALRRPPARQGDRFAERVLGPGELATWRARKAAASPRAATLPGYPLFRQGSLQQSHRAGHAHAHDLARVRSHQSCPAASRPSCCTSSSEWFEAKGLHAHLSLTDEGDHAASFVVVERFKPNSRVEPLAQASPTHCLNSHFTPNRNRDDLSSRPLVLDMAGTSLTKADKQRLATTR